MTSLREAAIECYEDIQERHEAAKLNTLLHVCDLGVAAFHKNIGHWDVEITRASLHEHKEGLVVSDVVDIYVVSPDGVTITITGEKPRTGQIEWSFRHYGNRFTTLAELGKILKDKVATTYQTSQKLEHV